MIVLIQRLLNSSGATPIDLMLVRSWQALRLLYHIFSLTAASSAAALLDRSQACPTATATTFYPL